MICSISGEPAQQPVLSPKSGHIFERRLIETYVQENGKDPINGEELAVEDLLEVNINAPTRPKPPQYTSIPSLLQAFQNEWDATAQEVFSLRQQLQETKTELSTALYKQDAAVRVVARLTKERDEARKALAELSANLE
ncbi:Pre-mRNA-processing factor 19 [Yarrowia sp. B02]|nr:Pre-mRNA-processing factor 19 [Yarrowia sp. B02]